MYLTSPASPSCEAATWVQVSTGATPSPSDQAQPLLLPEVFMAEERVPVGMPEVSDLSAIS
jgi:hypothetical protein